MPITDDDPYGMKASEQALQDRYKRLPVIPAGDIAAAQRRQRANRGRGTLVPEADAATPDPQTAMTVGGVQRPNPKFGVGDASVNASADASVGGQPVTAAQPSAMAQAEQAMQQRFAQNPVIPNYGYKPDPNAASPGFSLISSAGAATPSEPAAITAAQPAAAAPTGLPVQTPQRVTPNVWNPANPYPAGYVPLQRQAQAAAAAPQAAAAPPVTAPQPAAQLPARPPNTYANSASFPDPVDFDPAKPGPVLEYKGFNQSADPNAIFQSPWAAPPPSRMSERALGVSYGDEPATANPNANWGGGQGGDGSNANAAATAAAAAKPPITAPSTTIPGGITKTVDPKTGATSYSGEGAAPPSPIGVPDSLRMNAPFILAQRELENRQEAARTRNIVEGQRMAAQDAANVNAANAWSANERFSPTGTAEIFAKRGGQRAYEAFQDRRAGAGQNLAAATTAQGTAGRSAADDYKSITDTRDSANRAAADFSKAQQGMLQSDSRHPLDLEKERAGITSTDTVTAGHAADNAKKAKAAEVYDKMMNATTPEEREKLRDDYTSLTAPGGQRHQRFHATAPGKDADGNPTPPRLYDADRGQWVDDTPPTMPPPAAIEYLRKNDNPKSRKQFEDYHHLPPGSAEKYLKG